MAHVDMSRHFQTTVAKDVASLLIGDRIAGGLYRDVYAHAYDLSLVVKIEDGAGDFCNIHECAVWQEVEGTEFAKWFAPVERISDCGTVLIMRRTTPAGIRDLPKQVPAFFCDLHPGNWGWLDDRIVCHDYGCNLLLKHGLTKRMRKADWA